MQGAQALAGISGRSCPEARLCGFQKRAGVKSSCGSRFVSVCMCLAEGMRHAGVLDFCGRLIPALGGLSAQRLRLHLCVPLAPQSRVGRLDPSPHRSCPRGGPGLGDGGYVPILRRSALEFRPLPACSLLANYKLSDLYSLTSTRQRQAQQTSVGDLPPSTGGLHFS